MWASRRCGHIVTQVAGIRPDLGQRAVEMVHRQVILRDDDGRGVRCVVERDPRAAAGVRNA